MRRSFSGPGHNLNLFLNLNLKLGIMVRDTLKEISELLERHNASSNALAIGVFGDDQKMWDYLVSNELWGGAGSVADQAVLQLPGVRRQLEALLIRLGREQMSLGRTNIRTEMWVTAFEKLLAEGKR
jgi:hypothetical protein